METESRNMEWTGILSVVEQQSYKRHSLAEAVQSLPDSGQQALARAKEWTSCKTTVTFVSKLGQTRLFSRVKTNEAVSFEEEEPKQGFFASWSTAGIQRAVELIGVKRTKTAMVNGKEGMNVVLERLRSGGIVGVLEGMRQDRMEMMGVEGPWKQAWMNGNRAADHDDND